MNKYSNSQIMALSSAMLVILVVPGSVLAADSNSYRLYDDISNVADPAPLGSPSFSLNEAGETWVAQPLSGSNFQIVTAPPVASSSSSASSEESSSSSEEETGGGSGGGGRGDRSNPGKTPSGSVSTKPSAPTLPGQISDQPDEALEQDESLPATEIGVPGADLFEPTGPGIISPVSTESIQDVRRERRTQKPHYFDLTQLGAEECECSGIHTASPDIQKVFVPVPTVFQGPVPSLMVLLMAFGLGYASKTFRPGHVQVVSKKR